VNPMRIIFLVTDSFNIVRGLITRLSFAFQMELTFIEILNSSETQVDCREYQMLLADKEKVKEEIEFTAKFISEHHQHDFRLSVAYFTRTVEEIVEKKKSSTDIDDNSSITTECSNRSIDIES